MSKAKINSGSFSVRSSRRYGSCVVPSGDEFTCIAKQVDAERDSHMPIHVPTRFCSRILSIFRNPASMARDVKHIAAPMLPKASRPRVGRIKMKLHVDAGTARTISQVLIEPNEVQRVPRVVIPSPITIRVVKERVPNVGIDIRIFELIKTLVRQYRGKTLCTVLINCDVFWTYSKRHKQLIRSGCSARKLAGFKSRAIRCCRNHKRGI